MDAQFVNPAGPAVERKQLKMAQGTVGSLLLHKDEICLRCLLQLAKDLISPHPLGTLPAHHHPPLWQAQSHESSNRLKHSVSPMAEERLYLFHTRLLFRNKGLR